MNTKKHKGLLYLILLTILATVGIQIYWNTQNYKTNKQRLINDVQDSFDSSVEAYYADLAKTDFFAFLDQDTIVERRHNDNFVRIVNSDSILNFGLPSSNSKATIEFLIKESDSTRMRVRPHRSSRKFSNILWFRQKLRDSVGSVRKLFNRLITSASTENLDLKKIDSLLDNDLKRKEIGIGYQLTYYENDSLVTRFPINAKEYPLQTSSTSSYLIDLQRLEMGYSNPTLSILKKSLTGILLSLLLSGSIIFCLLYLLHTINKQKQLSEIKNDLISNITHEFKTPIATVTTALEGIRAFNLNNDPQKNTKYLDISNDQLKKLNQMVEKLLETATLDSERLVLEKEPVDLIHLLKSHVDKFKVMTDKKLSFKSNNTELMKEVDRFHFENVVSNLIDNAIKYGGSAIEVAANSILDKVEITVADDGGGINKSQREKIFDKFYRIPTGNRHDVKGFGIGLYYAKKIIEKHSGNLVLAAHDQNTIFKITL